MQPYLCSSSNYRSGSRSGFCGGSLLNWSGSSRIRSRRILQRRQGSRLIDHGGVLIDFSRSRHFALGLVFEEVTDASRDAPANLESLVIILLLFFDLP